MFVARVAHMIKLTEECVIAPYVWVHPDEERRGRRTRRKKGRPLRSRCPRTRWREPMSRTSNVDVRTRLKGGFSSTIKFCFRKHFGVGLIARHCCQHLGAPSPSAPSPLLSLRDRSQQSPGFAALRRAATAFERNADVNPLAQFAIVPVLDAHENQRAQDLLRRQAAATSLGFLQTPSQIAADLLDHVLLVVKKIGNGLQ